MTLSLCCLSSETDWEWRSIYRFPNERSSKNCYVVQNNCWKFHSIKAVSNSVFRLLNAQTCPPPPPQFSWQFLCTGVYNDGKIGSRWKITFERSTKLVHLKTKTYFFSVNLRLRFSCLPKYGKKCSTYKLCKEFQWSCANELFCPIFYSSNANPFPSTLPWKHVRNYSNVELEVCDNGGICFPSWYHWGKEVGFFLNQKLCGVFVSRCITVSSASNWKFTFGSGTQLMVKPGR